MLNLKTPWHSLCALWLNLQLRLCCARFQYLMSKKKRKNTRRLNGIQTISKSTHFDSAIDDGWLAVVGCPAAMRSSRVGLKKIGCRVADVFSGSNTRRKKNSQMSSWRRAPRKIGGLEETRCLGCYMAAAGKKNCRKQDIVLSHSFVCFSNFVYLFRT